MYTSKVVAAVLLVHSLVASADDNPGLGRPPGPDELADADFVIMSDGRGLPAGSGSADDGAEIFATHCLACHGAKGVDGVNDRLAGGHGSLTGEQPTKTVGSYWPYATTVFDYIRRAMPYQAPGSLNDDEVYAVTAFVLYINEIIGEHDVVDATTLPMIEMPNRDNFVWDYRP